MSAVVALQPTVPPAWRWEPRVLVVDDDPVVRLAAGRLLERLGLTVEVAADGREAVAMSAAWPYVAIFMDCQMPEVDGYRTTRAIQDRDGHDGRPLIIAVTSRPRHVCLAAGMDHHLAKPVRAEALERECRALGLLPAAQYTGADALAAAQQAVDAAAAEPTLLIGEGISAERVGELALAFLARARQRLPRLWRAANLTDGDALGVLAGDLAARARNAGAARVAVLLESIQRHCDSGQSEAGARLVPDVRAELDALAVVAHRAEEGIAPCNPDGEAGRASALTPPAPIADDPARPIRVAVADDDPLARAAIEAMIRGGEGLELTGSAGGAEEIVRLADETQPDVVVVDFVMPGGGGPAAAQGIRERRPGTQVIALSASESPETYLAMLQAGACGLLVKGSPPSRLVALIHRAAQRGSRPAPPRR